MCCGVIARSSHSPRDCAYSYFLTGSSALDLHAPNPSDATGGWLDDDAWSNLLGLVDFDDFAPFVAAFQDMPTFFKPIIDAKDPARELEVLMSDPEALEPLGLSEWHLTSWRALVVLRMLRPDVTIPAVQKCVVVPRRVVVVCPLLG